MEELLDSGNVLFGRKGNGKLKLYPIVTCTTQLGLLVPVFRVACGAR